jgi:hypothetical protein
MIRKTICVPIELLRNLTNDWLPILKNISVFLIVVFRTIRIIILFLFKSVKANTVFTAFSSPSKFPRQAACLLAGQTLKKTARQTTI